MRQIATIFTAMIILFNSISAYAWGPKGHDVIASIAEQNLTKKAAKAINEILTDVQ